MLTFTTENWGTAQTVKVTAAEDGDADQDADVTLAHAIGSTDDSVYDALGDQSVTVSITENDVVGVTINPTTLTVTEGDAAGASYAVTLTSQPAGDVTIAISGQAGYRPDPVRYDAHQQRADLHHGELGHGPDGEGESRRGRGRRPGRRRDPGPCHRQHGRLGLPRPGRPERHRLHHRERRGRGDHQPHHPDSDRGRRRGRQLHGGADQPARWGRDHRHQRPRRYGPDPVRYDAHQQRADLHHGELGHGPDGEGDRRRGRGRGPGRRRDPGPRHQQHGRLGVRRPGRPVRHRLHHRERRGRGDHQPHNLDSDRGRRRGSQLRRDADQPAGWGRDHRHQRPRRYRPDPVRYDAHQQRADLHHGELGHGPDG